MSDDSENNAKIDSIGLPKGTDLELITLQRIEKRLDQLLENQERIGTDISLAKREFELKVKITEQELKNINYDALLTAGAKFCVVFIAIFAIGFYLYDLNVFLFGVFIPKIDWIQLSKINPNAILIIIISCFVFIFGLIAIMLKSIFGKDKSETPFALEQTAKSIIDIIKTVVK